ncbi:hypothetical protein ACFSGX_05225 [Sphingomonas arantia]|uniref:Uncharacterized protein n=1 Tax=Sphingomonas arantia TaxID=1460676 RepID=A0ABW4TW31_9SPHN
MKDMVRFGVLAALVLGASLWGAAMVRRLNGVRLREAAMLAVVRAPRPVRADGDPVALVRAAAVGSGVSVLRLSAAGRVRGRARALVTLVGPEAAMRALLAALESGRPAVRFADWRLRAEPGAADRLRFEGTALVWSPDRRGR